MAQTQTTNPPNRRWLERVEVDFSGDRPKTALKLVVAVDHIKESRKFKESDAAVLWEGKIRCLPTSVCSVELYADLSRRMHIPGLSRRKLVVELRFASVEDSQTCIPVHVASSNATVNFIFSDALRQSDKPDDLTARARSAGEGVDVATAAMAGQEVILDKLGRAGMLIKYIASVVEAVGKIHPAFSTAATAVGLLLEICKQQAACRDAAKDLTNELEIVFDIENHIPELKTRQETREAVERMLGLIARISDFIRENNENRSKSTNIYNHVLPIAYSGKINEFKKEFAGAKSAFDRSIRFEIYKTVHNSDQERHLEKLHPIAEAHYLSGRGQTCLDDTRVELRASTIRWIESFEPEPELSWIFGYAGSGKSCVARTIAEEVKKLGFGLSCFFCKRDDSNLSKPENVLRTLSSHLAEQHVGYRDTLVDLLRIPDHLHALSGTIKKQFELLFALPLANVESPERSHVIIVDALDECGSAEDQKILAEVLLALSTAAPWIKVFVTSRAEKGIDSVFRSSGIYCRAVDINVEKQTDSDIRLFIDSKLAELELPLEDNEISLLVKQAAGLFIWCTTLFNYIDGSFDPESRLGQFISGKAPEDSDHPHHQLHVLYEKVLTTAAKDGEDLSFLCTVLGVVYVTAAYHPIPVSAIAHCLQNHARYKGRSKRTVGNVIRALHAVLREDVQSHGAVRVYHTSFLDFLRTKLESEDGQWERLAEIHALMYRSCLATMHQELKFNICELDGAAVLNKDIPGLRERISNCISQELQYSVEFWSDHLIEAGSATNEEDLSKVTTLLSTPKVLFWLEVMSLLDLVSRSVVMLRSCSVAFQEAHPELRAAAFDLERLVSSFSEAMESAPHVYLSVLPWLPTKRCTYGNVATSFKHLPSISGHDDDWSALLLTKSVGSAVWCFAYSPDGRHFATGLDDNTVRVWDAHTSAAVGEPLRGHEGKVWSVAFSPDGQYIVSGSVDGTVRVWDAHTRAAVGETLRGHEGAVDSVAFSPDGHYIVSSSDDRTVRVWNAHTRAAVGEPLRGHEGMVGSVAFSSDGQYIVSGSDDGTVRVWDAHTRAAVGEPLRGHENMVWSVAFSSDGGYIVSGSADRTVRVWDAHTRAAVGEPLRGHESSVRSVAVSPDSRYIASGSDDYTVRIWNAHTRTAVGEPLRGHEGSVLSVAFSTDGQYIVSSSSDRTVCVWDAHTRAAVAEPLRGRENTVLSVAFSPDGHYIVSGSEDGTVRVWEAHSGAAVGEPFRGHKDWVWSVAFSPDGRYIVSRSLDNNCTVVWDARTRTAVDDPPQGIKQVTGGSGTATSPDGRLRASTTGHNIEVGEVWALSETAEELMTSDPLYHRKHWNACCSRMADTDAWVMNGDELLLWIPYRYRYVFRKRLLYVLGRNGVRRLDVDLDKLYSYSGTRWTEIYVP